MSQNTSDLERQWLEQLASGNQVAFRKLYERYWLSVYRTARRFTKSDALAEDVVQEVFVILWKKREQFVEVLQLEYYLISITKNLTFKMLKRQVMELGMQQAIASDVVQAASAEDLLLEQQYERLVEQAVGMLPSQQKQVFHLAKVEGLSHKDIATQLNISHLTVKTHMAKALQFIRHYLQPHVGQYIVWLIVTPWLLF